MEVFRTSLKKVNKTVLAPKRALEVEMCVCLSVCMSFALSFHYSVCPSVFFKFHKSSTSSFHQRTFLPYVKLEPKMICRVRELPPFSRRMLNLNSVSSLFSVSQLRERMRWNLITPCFYPSLSRPRSVVTPALNPI